MNAKTFSQMVKLETRVADLARSVRNSDVRTSSDRVFARQKAGLAKARQELFALVDALTPEQAKAYGEYRASQAF